VLVARTTRKIHEARTRLARVGIDASPDTRTGGIAGWSAAGLPMEQVPQISVRNCTICWSTTAKG
jgi:hypothetical protein